MQILTPTGYRDIAACAVGDEVSAFDMDTGAPIVNTIETLQWVDAAEWGRWWQIEAAAPAFQFFRINGKWTLNSEQSIWRNGTNVCHAKHLIVGDVVYDDADQPITIISIDEVTAGGWWRFDIDGDHSYIVDGLTLHNASRFWVGGAGTWDSSTTTHWAASTGAAGGQSVPGSADTVTLDGSSGGGTVTVNFGGTVTIQTLAMGAFTGTFDNSVNNNNFTISQTAGFTGSGTGARSIKLGTATYTLSASAASWTFTTTTNLTYSGNTGANIVFTGSGQRVFNGGGLSHGNVSIGAATGSGLFTINQANTFASLSVTALNYLVFQAVLTHTISGAFSWIGSSGSQIGIASSSPGVSANLAVAAGSIAAWSAFRDITFTGSPVASDSFDLGNNSGISISAPGGTGTSINRAGVVGG